MKIIRTAQHKKMATGWDSTDRQEVIWSEDEGNWNEVPPAIMAIAQESANEYGSRLDSISMDLTIRYSGYDERPGPNPADWEDEDIRDIESVEMWTYDESTNKLYPVKMTPERLSIIHSSLHDHIHKENVPQRVIDWSNTI